MFVIVSSDSIMKPSYEITNQILKRLSSISEKIGALNAAQLQKTSPELRKRNRVKTIKASLEIEGNTLSEDQITAIIENKRVVGPPKDILEVLNAIEVYEQLRAYVPGDLKSFLSAHAVLMKGLVDAPGKLRQKSVGIFKGNQVSHIAPPAERLEILMKELFDYLKHSDDPVLIKSCVIHYEIEFIHPFMDGNGRMGRLWQTVVLLQEYPQFEFLPFETIIKARQEEYYQVLEQSDKAGKSTKFIEFMLAAIDTAMDELLKNQNRLFNAADRMEYFIEIFKAEQFTRKEYMEQFKGISTATASRDLKYGVSQKLILKTGDKRTAYYQIVKK